MTRGPGDLRRLLIVDDQPANIRVLAAALEGYEIFVATTGARALEVAAAGVDLVLLDVQMPGLDGFEVCRRLKDDPATRPVPVIFVTALGAVDDETRGFDAGGVDYITKPISPPVVRARVRTHLELKDARDRLEQLASIDALTGVANRRRLDACLEDEWRRAQRGRRWLSVALLDVDYFKRFNDRLGHARGDECLRAIAQAVAGTLRRPADLLARYGGEEFAVVAPDTDAEGACALVESILARVSELHIAHPDSPAGGRVSVSLGAVSLVPGEDGVHAPALERADRLLYQAKDAGRARAIHEDMTTGVQRCLGA